MTDSRSSFLSAARSFVDQVAAVPVAALDGPGLGDWDLRALVGHTSRSLVTVESYLDQPGEAVEVPTAAAYYVRIAEAGGADTPAITERGRQAGAALGDDPATYVGDLATRVEDKLAAYADDYVLATIVGAMRLDEYLRTRIFELVVHGLDISVACGVDPAFSQEPLVDATTLAAEIAARSRRATVLLPALTGRAGLPEDFSVV
jgi:hypothetical protein